MYFERRIGSFLEAVCVEKHRKWPANLTRADLAQGLALLLVTALVYQQDRLSTALVDGSGPIGHDREVEAGKVDVVEAALFDVHHPATLAVAARGSRLKVAWAAPGTVAGLNNAAFDPPGGHSFYTSR